jgi:hypothetical protein
LDAEPAAVRELLTLCAGLPLALAIFAAQAAQRRSIPLTELVSGLRDIATRLDELDAGSDHTNLRAVLSWSFRGLDAEAARVLGLVAAAPGPDISRAAAGALTALPARRLAAALRILENQSLIEPRADSRYRIHDLVRLDAVERAGELLAEDRAAAGRRLVNFYLNTANIADRRLDDLRDRIEVEVSLPVCEPNPIVSPKDALAWLTAEHLNLLAAQQLAAERDWHREVWQLAWTLDTFHWRQGHLRTFTACWEAGLAAAERLVNPALCGKAHLLLGRGRHGDRCRPLPIVRSWTLTTPQRTSSATQMVIPIGGPAGAVRPVPAATCRRGNTGASTPTGCWRR